MSHSRPWELCQMYIICARRSFCSIIESCWGRTAKDCEALTCHRCRTSLCQGFASSRARFWTLSKCQKLRARKWRPCRRRLLSEPGNQGQDRRDEEGGTKKDEGKKIEEGRREENQRRSTNFARNSLSFIALRLYIRRRDTTLPIYRTKTTIINRKRRFCGSIIVNDSFLENLCYPILFW